jgi:hypothetical protein
MGSTFLKVLKELAVLMKSGVLCSNVQVDGMVGMCLCMRGRVAHAPAATTTTILFY